MTDQVENHVLIKYSLLKKVGSGAYGHVWKVTDKKSGQIFALKKIYDAFQHSTDAQRTYREIVFLHELNHPNIIKLHSVIKADNQKDLYLVFQYMEADLHNAIGQKILKDAHNRYILYQLVKGLKFMHSAEVIHRDLKPSNLLLNSDCHLKICDFGLARSLAVDKTDTKDVVLTEQVATRWYRAPQVLLGSNYYDKSADIWSVGCILAQMLIGKPIFPGNSTLSQLEKILSFTGKPKQQDIEALNAQSAWTMINEVNIKQRLLNQSFKSTVPQEALELVKAMLSINPRKRPTASEILKHPYLSSFHKPKQQTVSDKVIQPPISDNTKLNLKQYRKLIYERIKKLYLYQKDNQKLIANTDNSQFEPAIKAKKSVFKSNTNSQQYTQPVQKKYIYNQHDQDKQINAIKEQKVQRLASQSFAKKSSQLLQNSSTIIRNTKTSNSSYIFTKNTPQRYSSASGHKKDISPSNLQPKHSSSSQHGSLQQYPVEDSEVIKKKNSLKQILRAKKQVAVESSYNKIQLGQMANKAQGVYYYKPTEVLMSSSTNSLKQHQTVGNQFMAAQQQKHYPYQISTIHGNQSNQLYSHSHSKYAAYIPNNLQTYSSYNPNPHSYSYQQPNSAAKQNRMMY